MSFTAKLLGGVLALMILIWGMSVITLHERENKHGNKKNLVWSLPSPLRYPA